MRYVVIGTGVAGLAAVEAIRRIDKVGKVTMVGDDPHGYYSRPGLAYYLTGELHDKALFPKTRDDYVRLNFQYQKARVTRINRIEKNITLDGLPALSYDKLLIATGASASPLTVPGAGLQGVVKLDHLDDARQILKFVKRGKSAVVVGGGITALELTEGLLARGMKVHYLLRGDRYWGNVLDVHESRIIETRLQEEGVMLHFHSELVEISGKNGRVSSIRLSNGEKIACSVLAYAIGIQPRVDLARESNLTLDRGIIVNEYLQTNDADIYAAGDVAQAYDPLTGRYVIDSLWNPAREQGRIAGMNMAGQRELYRKSPPFNVTRLAGLTTTIIGAVGHGQDDDVVGIARGDSEAWRHLPDAAVAQSGFDVNRIRLLVGERNLVGAVVMGDQTLSIPLQKIIAGKMDILPMRDNLLAPDVKITDVLAEYWSKYGMAMN